MDAYEPSSDLTKAVLASIAAPLPFVLGMAFKAVPFKERMMGSVLALAVPMSLRAIASTQLAGGRVVLTKHGELTEETKRSILSRIAAWFVPSEVKDVTRAIQADVVRMAKEGYAEEAWRLEVADGEVIISVISTSFLKVSADSAVDMFFNSVDALKALKNKVPFMGAKK
jgi:hypothetical protein